MDSILIFFLVSSMINSTLSMPGGKTNISKNATITGLLSRLTNRLHELGDVHAFLEEVLVNKEQYYNDNNIPHSPVMISTRMSSGTGKGARKGPTSLEEALEPRCSPVPTVVPIEYKFLDFVPVPLCTRVKRCGGYCVTPGLRSCQPTRTKNTTVSVWEYCEDTVQRYFGRTVLVEEHLSCGCACKLKPSDCQNKQRLDTVKCICVCNDYSPMNSCEEQGKIWDELSCGCECPDYDAKDDCEARGKTWDADTCSCGCSSEDIKSCKARDKIWHEESCSCKCPHYGAMDGCEASGKQWYEEGCICACPLAAITKCPTRAIFDSETCTCTI